MKVPTHLTWLVLAIALAGAGAASLGCGEEATEAALCDSLSEKLCDKWFECWPVASVTFWVSEPDCRVVMRAYCNNSEALYACDLDNSDLRDCDDGIEDSVCGSLPASCSEMVECYEE
jgi:hypothetical protein